MKIILHLCADIGSDSYPYQCDSNYKVIKVGIDIGVENFSYKGKVQGIIANPPCTDYSTAIGFHKKRHASIDILMHCKRIIKECNPEWYVIENPANGTMKDILGKPDFVYQPWWYGSPWTKKTALWGHFTIPEKVYTKWDDVPKLDIYTRPSRSKPSLAFLHKSAIYNIPEFRPFTKYIKNDADFRSLCSQGFAKAFKEVNK